MRANLRAVKGNFQMGMFPGVISGAKGEEAPRLKAVVSLAVTDRVTGETLKRQIPCECDEVSELLSWFEQVLTHDRTRADLESFIDKRDGGR